MSMSLPFSTCCLVMGATDPRSVGYACAAGLIQAGASKVTIVGRNEDKLNDAMKSLTELAIGQTGDNVAEVYGIIGDLKQPDTMKDIIENAVMKMGGSLNVLVISGGNGTSEYLGLDAKELAAYRMMYDVGVLSPLMLTAAAEPYLSQTLHTPGTVVMVSSMATSTPWPDTAPFNYAKAAQNSLVETLAFQYRQSNIRVNGVLPACIHTGALDIMAIKKKIDLDEYANMRAEAHPMGRNGTPMDVANSVVFLASPASGFTTGELLKVDGGLHLSNWFNQTKFLKQFVGGAKAT